MRKTLTTAALVAVATGTIVVGIAGPAAATEAETEAAPAQRCETASTKLTDRPDQSFGGIWANDTFTRTVKICQTGRATPLASIPADLVQTEGVNRFANYEATVTDDGTFTTLKDAKSPNKAVPITAITTGKMAGGYTAKFVAVRDFKHYKKALDGKAFAGDKGPSTTDWVKAMWGGKDFYEVSNLVAWHWSFWTCSDKLEKATEHWTNADPDVNEGDITGKTCPSPAASPSASAQPAASASASTGGQAGGLPVTGSNTGLLAGGALVLVAVGAGLFVVGHRRRKFIA